MSIANPPTSTGPTREEYRARFTPEQLVVRYDPPFEEVCKLLEGLSKRLLELLPDPSIGPDERLERLARVVPNSTMICANHRTARSKLKGLLTRLDELVPDPNLSPYEKLEWLVAKVHELAPGDEPRLYRKLEAIGDFRGADNGR